MARHVTALDLLIASPSDVEEERGIIRAAILEWNDVHGHGEFLLRPVMWERNTVPELGDRPQAIVNRQIVDTCDAIVGTFWTRVGTPTGEAESGTVEEIEKMRAAKKPVMLYFSRRPVDPEKLDAEQYAALKRFRERVASDGLFAEYNSPEQLRQVFSRHLPGLVERLRSKLHDTSTSEVSQAAAARYPAEVAFKCRLERTHPGPGNNAEQHDYELAVIVANRGTKTVRSWHADVEIPTILLHPGTVYMARVASRSTAEITVLRMKSDERRPLYPEEREQMNVNFRINNDIYYEHQEVFSKAIKATAYMNDEVVAVQEELVEALTNF